MQARRKYTIQSTRIRWLASFCLLYPTYAAENFGSNPTNSSLESSWRWQSRFEGERRCAQMRLKNRIDWWRKLNNRKISTSTWAVRERRGYFSPSPDDYVLQNFIGEWLDCFLRHEWNFEFAQQLRKLNFNNSTLIVFRLPDLINWQAIYLLEKCFETFHSVVIKLSLNRSMSFTSPTLFIFLRDFLPKLAAI